ncbi:type I polyketide synthase [Myxococcus sp. K15C18031901]|uniref:type I polyketide synthase n=1 Tax=Myxococcus dinghuensis TaxID=2906761 RepID=UPI0020A6FBEB|nr:type I polyketide synthase [Myxococcus dinghuensis]MCP3102824.1 type I polyketide synthase [Myxococcus dinghuensis]
MAKLPSRISELPAVKLAYLASQLRARRDVLVAEPIAVVGMSCRFPGGGEGPEAFWELLESGVDATREVPRERWDIDDLYDPTPGVKGKMYTRRGAFIDHVDLFEPSFFGIAPRDAKDMDPQQRLLLEECWRALERAGIPASGLMGSRTGVFVGLMHNDYNVLGIHAGVEMRSASLNYPSMAAGRIAHTLGLQGPALTVDTACSSSAAALHLACLSLRNDESDLALVGGVSLSLSPLTMMFECENRMLAADGRCKTFDASADGFARGEGCGVVVLERLSDALARGDTILGLIRGSALNHDGRSSALMVPNGRAQERVIRTALESCGVEPGQIGYVEAHGTGTVLGDPIEMEALRGVFGRGEARTSPLLVGSVKTNIGHLEAAAGIAGLFKVLLALRNEVIPPHLHLTRPNPNISWSELPVEVPTRPRPWPRGEQRRFAGLSSFGFSGTNVHFVIEEAPVVSRPAAEHQRPVHLLSLSARTEDALDALVEAHEAALPEDAVSLGDWCFTANAGRSHFEHRAAVTGATSTELRAALARLREVGLRPAMEPRRGAERPRPVFLFTGQGTLRPGVGRELFETWPVFREALQRCSEVLAPLMGARLEDVLFGGDSAALLQDSRCAQPTLVAVEYALAELWASWGIRPGAVLGHSLGEYAAAVVAGVLPIEDALRLVVERGRLVQQAPGTGAMLAVPAPLAAIAPVLAHVSNVVSVAALNGPEELVLSGDAALLGDVAKALQELGITSKNLAVAHAFHSPLMDPVRAPFEACVAGVPLSVPRLTFISALEGMPVGEALTRPSYWGRHLREPVRFADALEALRGQPHRTCLEVGPAPVLSGLGLRTMPDPEEWVWLPSLRPGMGETAQLIESLGRLYVRGFEVDWSAFDAPFGRRTTSLPTYPFQRERFWIQAEPRNGARARTSRAETGEVGHPLVGAPLPLAGSKEHRFTTVLDDHDPEFLSEHRVFGAVVLPAAVEVEMVLGAAHVSSRSEHAWVLSDMELERPLVLEDTPRELQTVLLPSEGHPMGFELHARDVGAGDGWVRLARGCLEPCPEVEVRVDVETELLAHCTPPRPAESFYALMARHGLEYGPSFQLIETLRFEARGCVAQVRLPDHHVIGMEAYRLHPLILDACFQVTAALFMEATDVAVEHRQRVPVAIRRLRWLRQSGSRVWVHARRSDDSRADSEVVGVDLRVLGEAGELLADVDGLLLKSVDLRTPMAASLESSRELLFELAWREVAPRSSRGSATGALERWLLVEGEEGAASVLEALVRARQGSCVTVTSVPGAELARRTAEHVVLDAEDPTAFARLLRMRAEEGAAPTTVVWLPGSGGRDTPEPSTEALARASTREACGMLHLVQAMARTSWSSRPSLWLLTRAAVAVSPEDRVDGLVAAPAWGLGRAAAIEHPELGCRLMDLDEGATVASLFEWLVRPPAENVMAVRGARLLGARLVRAMPPPAGASAPRIQPEATYLVTGGLGALGLATASWLVDLGARHLVLVGRSAPNEEASSCLDTLRSRGCDIQLARVDVADALEVERLVDGISARGPALRGVFHAAGVLEDAVLLNQDRERLARVLAPKVQGAWNLHRGTSGIPLDFFVLYSSAASLIGVAGQANYVAANSFLDALAHHRRARGLPALSINWGRWSGAGMAGRARGPDSSTLAPQRALRVMEALLSREVAQVGVVPFDDAGGRAPLAEGHGPLLSELMSRARSPSAAVERMQTLLGEFSRSDHARRRTLLSHYVQGRLGSLLGFAPGHDVLRSRASLNELGLDSLRAVELKNLMGRELGVDLPMSRFIDGTGIDGIVEALHAQLELDALLSRAPTPTSEGEMEELTL